MQNRQEMLARFAVRKRKEHLLIKRGRRTGKEVGRVS